jgi:Fic family protein
VLAVIFLSLILVVIKMVFTQIDELKNRADTLSINLTKEQVEAIEREKKIEHVWSSNALEGGTLDKYETASILETGATIHGTPVKDVLETLDLGNAFDFVQELAIGKTELTEEIIQKINQLVTVKTADKVELAGMYRLNNAYPFGVAGVHYTDPFLIRQEMGNLLWWNENVAKKLHPVEYAALLHQKFVTIHPFTDGNGRTARLLMEFALTSNGFPITNIQPDSATREIYMETLAESQRTGNTESFVELVASYVEQELNERIQIIELNEKNIRDAKEE